MDPAAETDTRVQPVENIPTSSAAVMKSAVVSENPTSTCRSNKEQEAALSSAESKLRLSSTAPVSGSQLQAVRDLLRLASAHVSGEGGKDPFKELMENRASYSKINGNPSWRGVSSRARLFGYSPLDVAKGALKGGATGSKQTRKLPPRSSINLKDLQEGDWVEMPTPS
eukprot:1195898-Prorocentrum_minimum.AAC.9